MSLPRDGRYLRQRELHQAQQSDPLIWCQLLGGGGSRREVGLLSHVELTGRRRHLRRQLPMSLDEFSLVNSSPMMSLVNANFAGDACRGLHVQRKRRKLELLVQPLLGD